MAKDLTQGFFERFLQKEYFCDAYQNRGRFRSFLLTCVKHYLSNEWDKQRAQRRGGGAVLLSIDQLVEESGVEPESDSNLNPDRSYERQWVHTLTSDGKI